MVQSKDPQSDPSGQPRVGSTVAEVLTLLVSLGVCLLCTVQFANIGLHMMLVLMGAEESNIFLLVAVQMALPTLLFMASVLLVCRQRVAAILFLICAAAWGYGALRDPINTSAGFAWFVVLCAAYAGALWTVGLLRGWPWGWPRGGGIRM